MRFFTCVLDPRGRAISEGARRTYETLPRSRQLSYEWSSPNGVPTLTGGDDPGGDPLFVTDGPWVAFGMARLDNRAEIAALVNEASPTLTDLALMLRAVSRYGAGYTVRFLGDFAIVAWNVYSRAGMAMCDAFGVQRLYYAEHDGCIAFSSRAEALATGEHYDVRYLATLVSQHRAPRDCSVYAGVRPIPPASVATFERGQIQLERYWRASDFTIEPRWNDSQADVIATCRQLFTESIRQRVSAEGKTWAQLSGGLDSSSVVSFTQWLAERGEIANGLAGTVTFVDRRGTGTDERDYSDTVIERWRAPNEAIVDPPMWYDERYPPPRTDQPRGDLHVYPRDSRLRTIVKAAGGKALLTGAGGDELFTSNMLFFSDWLAEGRIGPALREMAHRAALGRVSFWSLAYRNALLPLLPGRVHTHLVHGQNETPIQPWLRSDMLRRYGLAGRPSSASKYGRRLRHHYQHAVTEAIANFECSHHGGLIADALDMRHPFLYRPLVEFALRLPPELRARPHSHRWVVREAMKGILPEKVRTRVGKPGTADVLMWSLAAQRSQLAPLTHNPILAELGLIEASRLRAAFDAASRHGVGGGRLHAPLFGVLGIEAWLQIRSGRWPYKRVSANRS